MAQATNSETPLIVGAGPVGLAAALFLAREGIACRIVDAAERPSPYSKALAVNPRTLELLKPTGITQKMLDMGEPIRGARIWRRGAILTEISFEGLHPEFPFMLALSQATTERLLAEAGNPLGVRVERGIRMTACRNATAGVEADFSRIRDGKQEKAAAPWLLAADGANSAARESLKIQFRGSSFSREWHLADVPLETSLPPDKAHVFFLEDGGFLFLLRVVHDKQSARPAYPLWRVMGNIVNPLERLEQARATMPPVWASRFHISHRISASLNEGQVYFAGDAAHVHSPVGARGMNLGIEDAWVLSRLAKSRGLDRYAKLRMPVDRRVVKRIKQFTKIAAGEAGLARWIRNNLLPLAIKFGPTRNRMRAMVTGLDHTLMEI